MSQIDPTPILGIQSDPKPTATTGPRRPRFNPKAARVHIAATVDVGTDKNLDRWQGKRNRLSLGLVLDQVVKHGKRTAFRPVRKKKD